jgi:DNA recombination protein RmuC
MMTAIIVLGAVCALLLFIVLRRSYTKPESNSTLMLKQDITSLSDNITKLKDSLHTQISDRLDKNQEMMRESMHKQFSTSSKLIAEVTEKLTKLDETNKRVVNVADELKTLQNVLQNPKQRGVLGEYYLEQVLKNVMPPNRYKIQHKFKNGDAVDAVIILEKGKLLPIDSKFSLENYNRLVEEKDQSKAEIHRKNFKIDLKNRIDETAKYIRPDEDTVEYAFMFIPSEAIYYDLLINKVGVSNTNSRDLIQYAFQEKNVIIVSPTTFMAYLQTVLEGLRSLQIEEQAKEIQVRVGQLGRHILTYELLMQKLGTSLGTTVNHFNSAHKELGKIEKDIVRVTGEKGKEVQPNLIEQPSLNED